MCVQGCERVKAPDPAPEGPANNARTDASEPASTKPVAPANGTSRSAQPERDASREERIHPIGDGVTTSRDLGSTIPPVTPEDHEAYKDYENYDVPILTKAQRDDAGSMSGRERYVAFERMYTVLNAMAEDGKSIEEMETRLRRYGCWAEADGKRIKYGINSTVRKIKFKRQLMDDWRFK
jgi:hypothetical protein